MWLHGLTQRNRQTRSSLRRIQVSKSRHSFYWRQITVKLGERCGRSYNVMNDERNERQRKIEDKVSLRRRTVVRMNYERICNVSTAA
jgi:hypothetical protein